MINSFSLTNFRIFFLVFTLTILGPEIYSSPSEGLGLFFDGGQLKAINNKTNKEYQQSKVFGSQIDYQFSLGESFSLLLFATENVNKGSLPESKEYEYYKAGMVGTEFRLWFGPLFFGVHGGQYYLTWIESINSYSGIKWSFGNGLGLGFEVKTGWSIGYYSENSEKIDFKNFPDQRVEGNRLIIGYRW